MAGQEHEEEEKAEIISLETLIHQEGIQLPPVRDRSQYPPLLDPDGGVGAGLSMLDEDYLRPSVVFPPMNHEGLHLRFSPHPHHHDVREVDLDGKRGPPSPVSSSLPGPASTGGSSSGRWWGVGLEVLQFKVAGVVSWLRNLFATKGLVQSLHFPLAVSMVVLLLFYLRLRRRRRLQKEGIFELIRIIKEKDERIHQLLHQIARMNELLLATHHGVPMVSKAASG